MISVFKILLYLLSRNNPFTHQISCLRTLIRLVTAGIAFLVIVVISHLPALAALENMEQEIWKNITGYEGLYQISNLGRVKSLARIVPRKSRSHGTYNLTVKEKILTVFLVDNQYYRVALSKNGIEKKLRIHQLIARAFIPNPLNKPQVNHINGIKTDNKIENLEWCTFQENMTHAKNQGLRARGEGHGNRKLNNEKVLLIRKMAKKGIKYTVIAKKMGTCPNTVSNAATGKSWTHI